MVILQTILGHFKRYYTRMSWLFSRQYLDILNDTIQECHGYSNTQSTIVFISVSRIKEERNNNQCDISC